MVAKVTFFPVGNGDMTLIELESGRTILVDVKIRAQADDPDDDMPDVAQMLRARLRKDANGRPFVDAFLLSHPDQDHCAGIREHFHLGQPENYPKDSGRILIRETWSSPMVFRRASRLNNLCDDAQAFHAEVKRRVNRIKAGGVPKDGDRVLILGEDQDGKTESLASIVVKIDETYSTVNGTSDGTVSIRLLAPHPKSDDEDEEEARAKNRSSTIVMFHLAGDGVGDAGRFLSAGDAEVGVWERLWFRHSHRTDWLRYDILKAPHHCSWHSLSYDSWSKKGEDAELNEAARNALAQMRKGAVIIATSDPVKDDENDPPCIRAKREYEKMVAPANGLFICVGEQPSEKSPDILEYEIGSNGPRRKTKTMKAPSVFGSGAVGGQPLPHG